MDASLHGDNPRHDPPQPHRRVHRLELRVRPRPEEPDSGRGGHDPRGGHQPQEPEDSPKPCRGQVRGDGPRRGVRPRRHSRHAQRPCVGPGARHAVPRRPRQDALGDIQEVRGRPGDILVPVPPRPDEGRDLRRRRPRMRSVRGEAGVRTLQIRSHRPQAVHRELHQRQVLRPLSGTRRRERRRPGYGPQGRRLAPGERGCGPLHRHHRQQGCQRAPAVAYGRQRSRHRRQGAGELLRQAVRQDTADGVRRGLDPVRAQTPP